MNEQKHAPQVAPCQNATSPPASAGDSLLTSATLDVEACVSEAARLLALARYSACADVTAASVLPASVHLMRVFFLLRTFVGETVVSIGVV